MIKKENTYLPTKLAHHFDGQVGMGISLDWFWKLDVRKIFTKVSRFINLFKVQCNQVDKKSKIRVWG